MDEEFVVYTHSGLLLSHRRNEILPFATRWVELEYILSEISQKRQIPYDFTCVEVKKIDEHGGRKRDKP